MKILFFICLLSTTNLYAWKAYNDYDGVIFAKWFYEVDKTTVVTQAQRQEIIDANTAFSSNSINGSDFTNMLPSADEIALASTTFNCVWDGQKLWGTHFTVKDVCLLLTDPIYIDKKIYEQALEEMVWGSLGVGYESKKSKAKGKQHHLKKIKQGL